MEALEHHSFEYKFVFQRFNQKKNICTVSLVKYNKNLKIQKEPF